MSMKVNSTMFYLPNMSFLLVWLWKFCRLPKTDQGRKNWSHSQSFVSSDFSPSKHQKSVKMANYYINWNNKTIMFYLETFSQKLHIKLLKSCSYWSRFTLEARVLFWIALARTYMIRVNCSISFERNHSEPWKRTLD